MTSSQLRRRAALLLVFALALPAAPALAQKAPATRLDPAVREAAGEVAGPFRLSSADGERHCPLVLKADPAGPGLALGIDKAACTGIAFAADLAAWLPDPSGSLRLLNGQGRTIAEFTAATEGSYEALREGDGVYFLAPPVVAPDGASLAEVLGEWDLSRGAAPVCRWTLAEEKAGRDGLALALAPGCDPLIVQFGPKSWRLEGGNILVEGVPGAGTIRFARQEDGSWARVPERGRPLVMTRP